MQENNIKSVEQQESPKFLTKKKIIFGIIFIVILILVSTFTSIFFLGIDFNTITELGQKSLQGREWYLVGLIAVFIYYVLWSSYYLLINARAYNVKAKWWEWILFGISTIFINGITPFAVGSEPYKIYWLTRHGLNSKDTLVVISSTSINWTFTQILITWPSFIIVSTHYNELANSSSGFGLIAYWFSFGGMMMDIITMTIILTMSYSSRFHVFVVSLYNQILKKFKRNYKTKEEIINEFRNELIFKKQYIREMKKIHVVIFQVVGTTLIALTHYFAVYFAIQLLNVPGAAQMSFSDIFNISNVAISGNNFVPIPGAEGSMQLILSEFIAAFAGTNSSIQLDKHELNQAIFVWRSFLFYLPVILGLIAFPIVIWQNVQIEKRHQKNN